MAKENLRESTITSDYKKLLLKKWIYLAVLLFLTIILFVVSIIFGSVNISINDFFRILGGNGTSIENAILFNIRMPRAVTSVIIGAGLAIAGCIMQSVLRNPLASSSTLGVSQGASFGAALGIMLMAVTSHTSIFSVSPYLATLFAFLGSISTTAIILLLTRLKKLKPSAMVLVGVALSSLFSGGLTLIQYFADEKVMETIVFWTFGDLGKTDWQKLAIVGVVFVIGFVYFMFNSLKYNAMESGVDTAKSLGVKVESLTLISMAMAALLAGVSVAFVGIINFIGLIAPHIARKMVGNDHRFLIPASLLVGAVVLLLSDILSRVIITPVVLPIGAVTSFLGAPLFLYFIFKERVQ